MLVYNYAYKQLNMLARTYSDGVKGLFYDTKSEYN